MIHTSQNRAEFHGRTEASVGEKGIIKDLTMKLSLWWSLDTHKLVFFKCKIIHYNFPKDQVLSCKYSQCERERYIPPWDGGRI